MPARWKLAIDPPLEREQDEGDPKADDMIATLDRLTDDELPVPDDSSAAELRAFYAAWRSELAA